VFFRRLTLKRLYQPEDMGRNASDEMQWKEKQACRRASGEWKAAVGINFLVRTPADTSRTWRECIHFMTSPSTPLNQSHTRGATNNAEHKQQASSTTAIEKPWWNTYTSIGLQIIPRKLHPRQPTCNGQLSLVQPYFPVFNFNWILHMIFKNFPCHVHISLVTLTYISHLYSGKILITDQCQPIRRGWEVFASLFPSNSLYSKEWFILCNFSIDLHQLHVRFSMCHSL
jgi:hypothetical protein